MTLNINKQTKKEGRKDGSEGEKEGRKRKKKKWNCHVRPHFACIFDECGKKNLTSVFFSGVSSSRLNQRSEADFAMRFHEWVGAHDWTESSITGYYKMMNC